MTPIAKFCLDMRAKLFSVIRLISSGLGMRAKFFLIRLISSGLDMRVKSFFAILS